MSGFVLMTIAPNHITYRLLATKTLLEEAQRVVFWPIEKGNGTRFFYSKGVLA